MIRSTGELANRNSASQEEDALIFFSSLETQSTLGQSQWGVHDPISNTSIFWKPGRRVSSHKTLSTPIKLLSTLFINMVLHQHI